MGIENLRVGKSRDDYGYETNYTGGEGWVAVGTEPYTRTWTAGAGKDGTVRKSERTTRTVYGKVEDVYGGGGKKQVGRDDPEYEGFDRDTGEFDDIIGALNDDIAKANARADEYANKATEEIADNTASLTDDFNKQLEALTAGFGERYSVLEDLLTTQQDSMAAFQTMMQGQMQAAQDNYNQQMQMMQNMQTAYVPPAEENAFTAQIGDQRESKTRTKESNRLSDLSILSGLGTQASPTAGLSLA